jgi:hypothetical protein
MMAKVEIRKREKLWWMEEGEQDIQDGTKLEEAYEPSRLKPGYDGRNGPDVKTMYASKGEKRFDDLGASQSTAKATKKGDGDTGEIKVKETKQKIKEFEDHEDIGNLENDDMLDVPPEMEEPIDQDDEFGGDMEGMEGESEEGVAEEITVEIAGQRYKLVPEMPEEGMEGEEGMDDGMGEEGFDDEMGQPSMDVEAEEDDIDFPESKKQKKSIKESSKQTKTTYIKKLLKMKDFAESELKELFTGDYVINKQGLAGLDFTDVTGDKNYAVVDRAATGKQYTATGSESPYEPGMDAKGQTGGKVQKPASKKTVEGFKAWLKAQALTEDESDPGQDSVDFNQEDVFGQTSANHPMDSEKFANEPEIIGKEPDVLTKTDTQKANESTKARLDAVKKARMARRQEVVTPKAKTELLNEELDFKKLMKGEYNKSE